MEEPTKLFTASSLLMASLFAYSASVQLNDPDWYFWFPLYAFASVVNLLMNNTSYKSKTIRKIAKLDLGLGTFLFLKVVIEDYLINSAKNPNKPAKEKKVKEVAARYVDYGMAMLVGMSYGIPIVFLAFIKEEDVTMR
ncbi:hypothetical protein BVC80_1831g180 [Macleaya cordata]|uniref:Uncharacterized protein n=1 Tax=Macleaya cordata TaxID=56857 RepID=A0A200R7G1_MACCD|nr:hypothetical protein BVC80_1831g180 [Macleaya cordata]